MQGIVVTGKVSLGSSNSFIYVKALELDVTIAGVKVSICVIYLACTFLCKINCEFMSN